MDAWAFTVKNAGEILVAELPYFHIYPRVEGRRDPSVLPECF